MMLDDDGNGKDNKTCIIIIIVLIMIHILMIQEWWYIYKKDGDIGVLYSVGRNKYAYWPGTSATCTNKL